MEYEERISRQQGNYIVASDRDFENILIKKPIELITGKINPGDFTDLHGWFTCKCQYLGLLVDEKYMQQAIFYLGAGKNDLFNKGGFYYDLTYIIEPNRIGKSYKPGTFRDAYLIQKQNGKYQWK